MNPPSSFPAILISKTEGGQTVEKTELSVDDLMEGDVLVKVSHSTVNYKDGLAITGKSPVVRHWPMVPGIDFAGTVAASDSPDYKPGDPVVLTGWGVGETHWGAYAGYARVKAGWLVPLPPELSPSRAMAIGTAGFTAMLAVLALERHGITPEHGPALVTGAAGGVGSVAIALLNRRGFHVIASTGRKSEEGYLRHLGAAEVIDRSELSEKGRPLGKERWGSAIDVAGSHTLANALAQTTYGGAVAACGLAQGFDLPATVMPFILRGVALLGIDSVMAPKDKRIAAWECLSADLNLERLDDMTTVIGLDDVVQAGHDIIEGKVRGRTVVEIA